MTKPSVELFSVPANYGRGANDGSYYPIGLLSIGTHIRRALPAVDITVIDLHHQSNYEPTAGVVGISASSTLNYRNVLTLAQKAKDSGATVVLGGPHVTQLTEQVLRNRAGLVDYVIRGNGELAFESLLKAFNTDGNLGSVPSLSWRRPDGQIQHNSPAPTLWNYDERLPLNMTLLRCGIEPYWNTFQARLDQSVDAAFVVFTHFGCGFREMMKAHLGRGHRVSTWCSYCSLSDPVSARKGAAIVQEILGLLKSCHVKPGSKVLLKCYGDNVGTQQAMLQGLASAIEQNDEWRKYDIGWTFYCQSSRVTQDLMELFTRVGTKNLYIGFDSADDEIQRVNGLGTSLKCHWQAVHLCREYGIKIQAGFVLGCAGETVRSLENTVRFAEQMASHNVLERINSAVLFVIPGSPAYSMLCEREPWIRELDLLSTTEIRGYWLKHFCPALGEPATAALEVLQRAANRLDELSPGPHASMGFVSDRLVSETALTESMTR